MFKGFELIFKSFELTFKAFERKKNLGLATNSIKGSNKRISLPLIIN